MQHKLLFSLGLLLLYLFFVPLSADGQYNDAGFWLGVSVEKKITSSTSIIFSEELRMKENISQAGTIFSEIGVSHKLNRHLNIGLYYRLIEKRELDATYSTRHRLYFDLSGRIKVKKASISLRARIQSQVQDYFSSDDGRFPVWYVRTKLTVKYNITKKITPLIALELFYQLNNPEGNEFDNIRYYCGIEYAFNKRHNIEPFYLIQKEMNVKNPVSDFIGGLGYNFTF